jgi:broad specificity phosphatase PhoE
VASRLRGESITTAFCSDLSRAYETAQIILSGRSVSITPTPRLREMCWGAWEGLNSSEAAEQYSAEWAAWSRDPVNERPPGGGESFSELAARVGEFYRSTLERLSTDGLGLGVENKFLYRTGGGRSGQLSYETVLVVSHGGLLRALLAQLFEVPLHLYWRFSIRPGSVSILDVYPEGPIAEVIGETSHLKAASPTPPAPAGVRL